MKVLAAAALLFAAVAVSHAAELSPFGPGIWVRPGAAAVFAGKLLYDQGPDDGLETIAALRATKLHESLIELDTADAMRVLAALVVVLGEGTGAPPDSLSDLPPRGVPAAVTISWQRDDGTRVAAPAATLIRDRRTDRPLAALPAVWSGGALGTYLHPNGSGATITKPVLTQAGAVCALFDEENGSPLAIAVPVPADDKCWEANSAVLPPSGTPVHLVVTPLRIGRSLTAGGDIAPALAAAGGPGLLVPIAADRPRSADRDQQREIVAAARGAAVGVVFVPTP